MSEQNIATLSVQQVQDWLGFELETTVLWYHPTIAGPAMCTVSIQRSKRADDGAAA